MRTTLAIVLLLAAPLVAQEPGDSVRLRPAVSAPWLHGRLVTASTYSLTLRRAFRDTTLARPAVLEVWRLEPSTPSVVLGACGAMLGVMLGGYAEPRSLMGAALIGGTVGLLMHTANPGGWHRVGMPKEVTP